MPHKEPRATRIWHTLPSRWGYIFDATLSTISYTLSYLAVSCPSSLSPLLYCNRPANTAWDLVSECFSVCAPCLHCVRCRTSTLARGRTATYVTVRRRRTLQMLNYVMLATVVVNGHMPSVAIATKHAAQIEPSSICGPRVGPGHLLSPLSLHFPVFCSFFYFSLFSVALAIFLFVHSFPFYQNSFQAGGRRKPPNLGLVCCVYFVLSVFLS